MSVRKVSRRELLAGAAGLGAGGLVLAFRPGVVAALATDADSTVFAPNVFVQIAESGAIRLVAHRSEMGQGVRTSMPMLLAEELEARWEDIEVVQADGHPRYGDQNTDGSQSVRLNWQPLREAGAAAREMLIEAAAKRWGVAAEECRAEGSQVIHAASERRLGYGELAAQAAELPVPEKPRLKEPGEWKILGKPRALVDVGDMVQGKAVYGIDLQLPGMLHASIERSPTVRGTIASYDAERALAVPGVERVVEMPYRPQPLNCNAGLGVVAESTFSALEGRKALEVEWDSGAEELETSEAFRRELEEKVAGDGKVVRQEGDWAKAREGAETVVEATYHGPYLVHAPMEPLACTAIVEDGKCELWAPVQDPQTVRRSVAQVLEIEPDDVTVHVTLLGGGFGRKSKPDFTLEAAYLAKQLDGTPVKLTWTREDEVRHGFYRAENIQRVEATLDAEKRITGWRQHTVFPTILSTFMPQASEPSEFELGMGFTNMPFRIPNVRLESSGIRSDLRIGWLRSVCNTFHAYSSNCFVDELAEAAGKDPVELRLELLGEPRQLSFSPRDEPYKLDTGRLARVISAAAEMAEWGKELPAGQGHGFAAHFSFLSYIAMALRASVEEGKARVHEVDCVVDCGTVVNPDTVAAQIEGSVVFGLSMALYGEITVRDGAVRQSNFHDYPVLRIDEMPRVNVKLLANNHPPSGLGEPGVPPVAPALANALYRVTGKRIYDLPLGKQGLA